MSITVEKREELWNLGMSSIQALEVERGILASGKEELYGCIFGRDSLITSLLLLESYQKTHDAYILALVRNVLINLAKLQGREHNPQSGEEPGKIIHEFRPDNHEHLTQNLDHPWYLYPDGIMRSYDTVDATPLFLMAVHEYQRVSNDSEIVQLLEANVRDALRWIITNIEKNPYGLLSYDIHPERTHGGLSVQSWMDSSESLFFEESSERPTYPIAPIEAQAYAYRALMVWGTSEGMHTAEQLKKSFAHYFAEKFPYAIDGEGRPLSAMRSSVGHILWSGWKDAEGNFHSLLSSDEVKKVVERLMEKDMFVPGAGIRTLSESSSHFEANSYHNGSLWPHDIALIALGFEHAGFAKEARELRDSLLQAYVHFGTPLELFIYNPKKGLGEYRSDTGQSACRVQAWSAAALLAMLSLK
jgi:glycogen debranching enzyme